MIKGHDSKRRLTAECGKFRQVKGMIVEIKCYLKFCNRRKEANFSYLGSRSKKRNSFSLCQEVLSMSFKRVLREKKKLHL